jgi:hypothetical protein
VLLGLVYTGLSCGEAVVLADFLIYVPEPDCVLVVGEVVDEPVVVLLR